MTSFQLIGMVHALPLPGSPSYRPPSTAIAERAVADAVVLEQSGFDAVLVENYGDAPFFADQVPPATVASLARVVAAVRDSVTVPVGVNVLRNDALAAMSIAAACDAQFIRVNVLSSMMYTDQGPIVGQAARLARLRAALDPGIEVLADLFVKHATPPPGLRIEDAAADLHDRGMADGIVVSGRGTGLPADEDMLRQVRRAVPDARLLVGSGVDAESVSSVLRFADGVIVGTATKEEGDVRRPVDPARARAFVQAARSSKRHAS